MTITEFILARVAEDEEAAHHQRLRVVYAETQARLAELEAEVLAEDGALTLIASGDLLRVYEKPDRRVLAECEAKRRIVELHESWPVLVEGQPTFEAIEGDDPSRLAVRASQQIAWLTQQEYRARFGSEPPTAPMMRALASVYADHPDFQDEWRNA